jgi:hypothetical protein
VQQGKNLVEIYNFHKAESRQHTWRSSEKRSERKAISMLANEKHLMMITCAKTSFFPERKLHLARGENCSSPRQTRAVSWFGVLETWRNKIPLEAI